MLTLWRYRDLPEALIAQAKLDATGIRSFLGDQNMVRLNWFYSNFIGGLRLQVSKQDVVDALEVLQVPIPESYSREEVGEAYQQPRCPKCGSLDIELRTINRPITFALLYLGIALLIPAKEKWVCESCEARWQTDEREAVNQRFFMKILIAISLPIWLPILLSRWFAAGLSASYFYLAGQLFGSHR